MSSPWTIALRHELVYRTTGGAGDRAMLGCGFMLKPGLRVDSINSLAPHYSAVYVLRGRAVYRTEDGTELSLEAGSVFQRFPQRRHSLIIDPKSNWAECFVALDSVTQTAVARFGIIDGSVPVVRPGVQPRLAERFDRLLKDLKDAAEAELPRCLLQLLELIVDLRQMGRPAAPPDEPSRLVEAASRALGRDLASRTPLPQLLKGTGAGYERLRKLFQARTGLSPAAWRLRCRMDAASAMLMDRKTTVKDIAYRLGYPNPYAFSAQFKKMNGASPRQFREGRPSRRP